MSLLLTLDDFEPSRSGRYIFKSEESASRGCPICSERALDCPHYVDDMRLFLQGQSVLQPVNQPAIDYLCPGCGVGRVVKSEPVFSPDGSLLLRSVKADGTICCSPLPWVELTQTQPEAPKPRTYVPVTWFDRYLANDKQARKEAPLARGLFGYFPNACLHVAHVSFVANEQHNPGEPVQWAFNKSSDEPDCELRHMLDAQGADPFDDDGLLHRAKKAWRALADLERYLLGQYSQARPGASVTGVVK